MSVQISTPCMPATSICSGDYGCGSDTSMVAVARIMPVFTGGKWDPGRPYGALEVVEQPDGTMYISMCPVPAGTPLDDCKHWRVYNENMWLALEGEEQARLAADEELRDGVSAVEGKVDALKAYVDSTEGAKRLEGYAGLAAAYEASVSLGAIDMYVDASGYGMVSSTRVRISSEELTAVFPADVSEDGVTVFEYRLTSSASTLDKHIYSFDGTDSVSAVPTYAVYYR